MRRQIAPWFGSKAALASEILPELGPHKCYFEPFGGGLGLFLQKPFVARETINDLHDDLINLARILADERSAAALETAIDRRLCCEALNRDARRRLQKPFVAGLDRAIDFFFVAWMATHGVMGADACNSMAHGYSVQSNSCAAKLRQASASIAAFHQRMRLVTILQRDAFKLLGQIRDQPGVLIYCDPPYVQKGGSYEHDFAVEEHTRLAEALRRFQLARVVVSYTAHPVLDKLYAGWTRKVLRYESRANRRAKVKQVKPPEILLINGPLLQPDPIPTRPGPRRSTSSRLLAI